MSKYYIEQIEAFVFEKEWAVRKRRWWWFDEIIDSHYSKNLMEDLLVTLRAEEK
jgi:hypothetical protein